ncbi:MAG: type II secretion system protein [Patescibacteria group bacterium]
MKKKEGFTLIELVVVMAIIAVLAVLVIGAITIVQKASRNTKYRNDGKTVRDLLEAYYAKKGRYPCGINVATGACLTTSTDTGYYSRLNAYSFFDTTVTANTNKPNANGELGATGEKLTEPSSYPKGDVDRLCYTQYYKKTATTDMGQEYLLWFVTEDEARKTSPGPEGCDKNGGGWPGSTADGGIHGPGLTF